MEGVTSVPAGGIPVQVGGRTYLDVSHLLKTSDEPVNTDDWVVFNPTREERMQSLSRYFSNSALYNNPAMSSVKQEIDAKTDVAIQSFFDGTMSEEELADTFQSLYSQFANACEKNGYPFPLPGTDRYEEQSRMDSFYSEFRRKILETAVNRNAEEGKQYVTGELNGRQSWKYYNSDYYFQSEEAIAAISKGIMSIAQEKGYDDFSIRDYQAEGLNLYYNFNSAFSNGIAVSEQYMLDPDQVPPRDFQWFFQTGTTPDSCDGPQQMTSITTTYPDGRTETVYIKKPPESFDPMDGSTGITWARYRDANGNWCQVSADILFARNGTGKDLQNVADLLTFLGGNSKQDAAVNQFLKNLQVYPKGYFERMLSKSGLNISV